MSISPVFAGFFGLRHYPEVTTLNFFTVTVVKKSYFFLVTITLMLGFDYLSITVLQIRRSRGTRLHSELLLTEWVEWRGSSVPSDLPRLAILARLAATLF